MHHRLRSLSLLLVALGLFAQASVSHALITIEIDRGTSKGIPIAIVPFSDARAEAVFLDESFADIVHNDLVRTGRFLPLDRDKFLSVPHSHEQVNFADWLLLKVDYLLIGTIEEIDDSLRVRFQLLDVLENQQVVGRQYTIAPEQLRTTAHSVAGSVYETVTGERASFNSRIAYCTSENVDGAKYYSLTVADYDGHSPKQILRGARPILSPSWSPDSAYIAYSVLEKDGAKIYVQEVATGVRRVVREFEGHARSPAWSPDGDRLAFSLSINGNSDIYVMSLDGGELVQITRNLHIDTEPTWSPDGRRLAFTSGRSGRPQIYVADASGKSFPSRLTFEGRYNVGASFSPDGTHLLLISNQGAGNQATLYDIDRNFFLTISSTNIDDSAIFSPNGDLVMYILEGARRQLFILSPDGSVRSEVPIASGQIREVAWETRKL